MDRRSKSQDGDGTPPNERPAEEPRNPLDPSVSIQDDGTTVYETILPDWLNRLILPRDKR